MWLHGGHTLHSALKRLVLLEIFCQNYFLCKFLHRLISVVSLLLHIGGTPPHIHFSIGCKYVLNSPGSHSHKYTGMLVVVMAVWLKCRNLISDVKL